MREVHAMPSASEGFSLVKRANSGEVKLVLLACQKSHLVLVSCKQHDESPVA